MDYNNLTKCELMNTIDNDMLDELVPPVNENDHRAGPDDAPVTLVQYGDYECPHCGKAHPVVKTLKAVLRDNLRIVYRHFPLRKAHRHAVEAAEAAEAAAAQGKFWQMHDLLYKNQRALEHENLIHFAYDLNLDVDRFRAELESGRHMPVVDANFSSGVRSGVNGTPTFFINGMRHNASYDYDALYEAIQSALHKELGD